MRTQVNSSYDSYYSRDYDKPIRKVAYLSRYLIDGVQYYAHTIRQPSVHVPSTPPLTKPYVVRAVVDKFLGRYQGCLGGRNMTKYQELVNHDIDFLLINSAIHMAKGKAKDRRNK